MYNEHQKPYHIGFINEVGARYAILPGDPGRVEKIAAHLANPRFVAQNREYTTWVGEIEGKPVYVMSTGMGGPSAAIGIEELHQIGVDTVIRIGTCGGMALPVKGGDLVVATGAIRMEGTSKEFILCKWAVNLLERELLYLALSSIVPTFSSPPNASCSSKK